jgi:hypothetical protein
MFLNNFFCDHDSLRSPLFWSADHGFLCSRWGSSVSVHFFSKLLKSLPSECAIIIFASCMASSGSEIAAHDCPQNKAQGLLELNKPSSGDTGRLHPSWAAWLLHSTIEVLWLWLMANFLVPLSQPRIDTHEVCLRATNPTPKHSTVHFIWWTHTHTRMKKTPTENWVCIVEM